MASPHSPGTPSWISRLIHGGSFPFFEDFTQCLHGWSSPPGDTFPVRGPDYLTTKTKVPGGEWLLQPLGFDLLKSSSKISHIIQHPQCRVRAALDAETGRLRQNGNAGKPFLWVINFQTGVANNLSLIMYYVSFHYPEKGSLVQRFLDGDDAFRNAHFKVLTGIPRGPWIVKASIGERGAASLVGKINTLTYFKGENYMEVDIDPSCSRISRFTIQVAMAAATMLTADLAFVLEGTTPGELPERILGAIRFANLDISCAAWIDSHSLGEENPKRSLWKSFSKLLHGHDHEQAEEEEEEERSREAHEGLLYRVASSPPRC